MTALPHPAAARAALRGLVPDSLSDAAARDAYAAATWSTLIEPGDGTAGALIAERGVAEALDMVLSGPVPGRLGPDGVAPDELRAARARWLPRRDDVEPALAAARRANVRLVLRSDPVWPRALDDLGDHAPVCLWVRGDPRRLPGGHALAVVGARAATAYGTHVATELGADLAAAGVTVVSGAAYGIDGAAHRGALAAGGTTVAVLAGGVDRPYPAGHDALITSIADSGVVVSEVPCASAPTKWRFLARNRVIAALCGATVVVEAAHRSGALNTAHHAAALGRPLGVVPGPVTSAASAGCHRLLREADAICITRAAEALELLGLARDGTSDRDAGEGNEHPSESERTDDRTRVMDALSGRRARPTAEVARRCGLAAAETAALLAFLELEGRVERGDGGWLRPRERAAQRLW